MTEWNPADYSRHSTLQQVMADEQLALLTLAGTERVLDVGCGVGNITAKIAERLPHGTIVGVDPSWDMISFATNLYARSAYSNLRFEVADARYLPFENEFDLVVSFNALHWVPEQEVALRSIRAALRPRGKTLFRFVPQGELKSIEDVIEETRKSPRWAKLFRSFHQPFAHFTPAQYGAMAAQSGFMVERIAVHNKAWDFKTREALAGFCQATFVEWTRLVPKEEQADFIADVLERYRAVAATSPAEAYTFNFYQMEVMLAVG